MSFTATVWVAVALVLLAASARRPPWSVALYMLTFFAAPHLWWWGKDLPALRYAYVAGFVMLTSVIIHAGRSSAPSGPLSKLTSIAAVAMLVNATLVHVLITETPDVSWDSYLELIKFVLLYFLVIAAVSDRRDLGVVVAALAVGASYLAFEVTYNERGSFTAGRLEEVGAPGADTANGLASMLLLLLPIIGSLFLTGSRWHKALVMVAAPLVLNVVIMCNSRGAFLGLIGGGLVFLFLARGPSRKRAIRVLLLGAAALYLLLGDPKILERFTTTFVGAEERDRSAASRMEFWKAGLLMLGDYPMGAGGGAFKFVHARKYLVEAGGNPELRGLHNGYLTDATDWGVQGLFLKLLFVGCGMAAAYRTVKRCRETNRPDDALVGVSYISAVSSFMIVCIFGSFLASEWTYWVIALLVRYADIYASPGVVESRSAASTALLGKANEAVA